MILVSGSVLTTSSCILVNGPAGQLSDKDLRSWDYATSYMVQKNPNKDFFGRLAFTIATGEADDPDDILASYEYRDDASDTGSSG